MKLSDVLVRPVITEKVNRQMERSGRYTFVVGHAANKLEIKKAVVTLAEGETIDLFA